MDSSTSSFVSLACARRHHKFQLQLWKGLDVALETNWWWQVYKNERYGGPSLHELYSESPSRMMCYDVKQVHGTPILRLLRTSITSEGISNPIDAIRFLFFQNGFCCTIRNRSGIWLDLGYGAHPNRKELFPVTRFLLTRVVILSNRNRNVSVSVKKIS